MLLTVEYIHDDQDPKYYKQSQIHAHTYFYDKQYLGSDTYKTHHFSGEPGPYHLRALWIGTRALSPFHKYNLVPSKNESRILCLPIGQPETDATRRQNSS